MYGRFMYGRTLYAQPSNRTFGTAFTKALTESFTLVDSVLRSSLKSLSDSPIISDSLAKIATLVRSLSDIVTVASSVTSAFTVGLQLTETLVLVEVMQKTVNVVTAEAYTLTATLVKQVTKPWIDLVSAVSTFTIIVTNIRNPFDSLTITENLTKGITKEIDDAPTLTEVILFGIAYIRSLTDSFSLTDTIARAHAIANRSLTDTLILADSAAHAMTRSMNDLFKLIVDYHAVHPGWGKIGKTIATWIKQRKPE